MKFIQLKQNNIYKKPFTKQNWYRSPINFNLNWLWPSLISKLCISGLHQFSMTLIN